MRAARAERGDADSYIRLWRTSCYKWSCWLSWPCAVALFADGLTDRRRDGVGCTVHDGRSRYFRLGGRSLRRSIVFADHFSANVKKLFDFLLFSFIVMLHAVIAATYIAYAGTFLPFDNAVIIAYRFVMVITLRRSVYCNRSYLFWVGVFICLCVGFVTTITRNCVHRSSPNWVFR